MTEWQNPCGGKRWRVDPSGYIEIEGEGYPEYEPGSDRFRYMDQTWQNWAPLFRAAAREFHVPANYLVALASMESGLWSDDPDEQATIGSSAGAQGIMQVMPSTARLYEARIGLKLTPLTDPRQNIRAGAAVIADHIERDGSFPAASARYNSGRLCSPGRNEWNLLADGNYPRHVIIWNNTALSHLAFGSWWPAIAAGALVVGGGAMAFLVATNRININFKLPSLT
jgi:hypothetical protein